ncbi:TetR/AcrR family transcriptional regulator [Spirillospora sp. NPDC127200]
MAGSDAKSDAAASDTATRSRRDRKREAERQAQILSAAAAVFARQGYHGARMDDVVAESGLSKGTLYWYFKSKEELATSLVHQMLDAEQQALAVAAEADGPALQRLERLTRTFARNLAQFPDHAPLSLELLTLAQRVPEIKDCFTAHHRHFTERLRTLLADVPAAGDDAGRKVDAAAVALAAVVDGLVLHWTLSSSGFDLEARLWDAVRAVISGL